MEQLYGMEADQMPGGINLQPQTSGGAAPKAPAINPPLSQPTPFAPNNDPQRNSPLVPPQSGLDGKGYTPSRAQGIVAAGGGLKLPLIDANVDRSDFNTQPGLTRQTMVSNLDPQQGNLRNQTLTYNRDLYTPEMRANHVDGPTMVEQLDARLDQRQPPKFEASTMYELLPHNEKYLEPEDAPKLQPDTAVTPFQQSILDGQSSGSDKSPANAMQPAEEAKPPTVKTQIGPLPLRTLPARAAMTMKSSHVKLADNGNSKDYELAFSNIAHSYVQGRAPNLAQWEVGFQLLDKSDEGDKAVGVFGYKAGPNWFYAPVFYLAGKVKGYELLYIKHENIFVPLRENWVNYLLSKRPSILGSSIDRNDRRFGIVNPDLTQLSRSPNKWASENKPGFDEDLHKSLAKAAFDTNKIASSFSGVQLDKFLQEASLPVVKKFVDICNEFPKVAATYDEYYGIDSLSQTVNQAQKRWYAPKPLDLNFPTKEASVDDILGVKQADSKPNNGATKGLRVIGPENTYQSIIPQEKDQAYLERMLKKEVLLEDNRIDSEMSRLYTAEPETKLTNPNASGIYDVLLKAGDFERCFVSVGARGATSNAPFITVVKLSDPRSYMNARSTDIWVSDGDGGTEFDKWWKDQSASKSISDDDWYIAIGERGQATIPFRRSRDYCCDDGLCPATNKPDGETIYEVEMDDHWSGRYDRPPYVDFWKRDDAEQTGSSGQNYDKYRDGARIHLSSSQGSRLRSFEGDIYVPSGFKIVKVENRGKDGHGRPDPIRPGNLATDYFKLIGKTASFELGDKEDFRKAVDSVTSKLTVKAAANGIWSVNERHFTTKSAAIIHIASEHGLREADARRLLDEAVESANWSTTYRIKYAERISQDTATAPMIPPDAVSNGSVVNPDERTTYNQEYALPIPGLHANWANRNIYNPNTHFDPNAGGLGGGYSSNPMGGGVDEESGDFAAAVNSGQKEVFDTAVIGTLLKAVRDDSLVDRYLGPLMSGVDAIGRLLFMFYWHGDEFADRYGKQDMPELEDSLRNAFEQAGDVVLFLRQKSVSPQGDGDGSIDLGASSNATNGL